MNSRRRILEMLRSEDMVSGEEIADDLSISRTAVWKQIKTLQELGYGIEILRNKGYRLKDSPDILIPEEIGTLHTERIGSCIEYRATASSTNRIAKEMARKGAKEGTVIIAEEQTEGRGRMARTWYSPRGGLWFSVILYPDLPPDSTMIATMMASISVSSAIEELTGIRPVIKWPNDLLINGKKVCGILTEMDAETDRIQHMVIGIGIDVNNDLTEELSSAATTLKAEAGAPIDRIALIRAILNKFDINYSLLRGGDSVTIRNQWIESSGIVGREVLMNKSGGWVRGTVERIDEAGCLIVSTSQGDVRMVSGDIEYLQ